MATTHGTPAKIRSGDWLVVCDGRKAMILENTGTELHPALTTREVREAENPPTREQGADAPGRTQQSVGARRSSVRQTDWHDQAEKRFLDGLASRLDRAVADGETRAIVLIASPRALGMIRPALSGAAGKAITAEIAKDYVNLPVDEITRRVTG